MSIEILVNVAPRESRAAITENGVVQEIYIERASRRGLVSNLYKGRVSRVLPGMQAAFVEIGLERTAFLHAADIANKHSNDDTVVMSPATLERHNENLVGGDIGGGSNELSHLFTRPVARVVPYSTPVSGLYLCSSSTPPGGGVHGMCGYFAAKAALQRELR